MLFAVNNMLFIINSNNQNYFGKNLKYHASLIFNFVAYTFI